MKLGRLGFKPTAQEEGQTGQRQFKTWNWHYSHQWYQGEVNYKGEWDGRGVVINPNKFLQYGHFKNGQGHGPYISIAHDDMVVTDGSIMFGKLEGKFVYTMPDGTS